jgi:hypothetical protein
VVWAHRTKCILLGRFALESTILRRIVYISGSDCPPANSTRSWDTSYWPLQTRGEAGNSSKSRSFPVLAEGLAHHESSNPHFLVCLWPYVLVLVLAWIAAPLSSSCQLFYSTTLISGTMAAVLGPPLTLFLTPLTPRRPRVLPVSKAPKIWI